MPKSLTAKSAISGYAHVNIEVQSEDGTYIVKMTPEDVARCKVLLKRYARTGDWADELNTILSRSARMKPLGIINTMGDGGGWYEPIEAK